ncbi:sensor histidine kinase [Serratia sp. SRS-8-S-2018]|uniref:ATP-binding protein n=1 Tax=Serratia sp. SRS-8-S-2018 TaxID=2591107 RepID=UPI0011402283|nr:sensor histidine kinase [Serratia sp. SRS-8-S-2018]TPW52322.1 sensor histidine kinase [Serratia sp. SRS-8-S-2018]
MRLKLSFQIKLFLCLVAFSCLLLTCIGAYTYYQLDAQLHRDLGARAQVQAREIALIPSLVDAVEKHDAARIAALMKKIRASSDASYIVIGDSHARHLYHSEYEGRLGTPMIGGDNKEVLEGKSIISIRKGGIGVSLRSKAPILDENNHVIGIVSVGYLKSHIDNLNARTLTQIIGSIVLLLIALFVFSWLLSKNLKRQMFWLEPKEIALLVRQQKALLEAIYEGVIAIDPQQRIITINHAARELLDLHQPAASLLGRPIGDVIQAQPDFFAAAQLGQDTHDEVCRFNHVRVIASRVRIMQEQELQGWVISFRDKNDINTLSSQLSQVKRYADNLRIMRHEQLNWTATLAGLLHMQRYDEAIRYVEAQSEGAQEILDFISQRFSSAALNETELMSIVGNLLDNAVEATLHCPAPHDAIELYISDGSDELVIEVADRGTGIAEEIRDTLFEQGVTTKADKSDHGIGLHLVASHVAQAHGSIEVSDNEPHGAIFSIFIPK